VSQHDLEALGRAHQLFAGSSQLWAPDPRSGRYRDLLQRTTELNIDAGQDHYQRSASHSRAVLASAARTDSALARVIAAAHRDRAGARELTGRVLDAARVDAAATAATPLAQREAMRRRAARLRAQRAHVVSARGRARRHLAALRALRYRMSHHRAGLPSAHGRAGLAVRAALSRLGSPYVWGATGPSQFDCSGLVQWAYAQAGVHLDRTTYDQINDGVPVPRSLIRPGDLVFPHAGHVQMAIGNNLVVEAPYSGASVRISRLGGNVQIRRPR
jgi:cell wall-associated NlpC family hydrolase